ncbi:monophenol monooxygenase [Fusarium subglutinans]|uniref:Monophenol monooxygenase n=1 Tax=Gibberella subglutinans TaxID=42677 RepID=A0A8H5V073_GIBSU|nr:monophenol monooxygenase [Fusarium subglutinans]KAF5603905.1 monophenol monooxygenase [Fusarium subglutinans]
MFFSLFTFLALALPLPAMSSSNSTCTPEKIQTRIEWANMASDGQKSYLKAVKCLMQLPAQTGIKGTVTRFDDMNAMHQVQAKAIHLVLLRDECGYKGPTPWWDETRDAGNFMDSPLLDPDTGFGGNGTGLENCVTDGPFANTTLHIGRRSHGGYRCEPWCFIDRLWWKWQSEDLDSRLYQLGGPSAQGGTEELTLDYVMTTYGIRPNVTIKEVMNVEGGFLCYKYDY